ncbi:MAG: PorP/SprF family type IX secretion system membrane protein [Bacteroidetes bacterium]|nr:PorP/SprF family type IX secretion system membrane protein [Bacteroidota bacterium]
MLKYIKTYQLVLWFLCSFSVVAQDQHFSQFSTAPLMQNPALAGAVYDMQANINYKNQWGTVAQPFSTSSASFDMKLNNRKKSKSYWATGVNLFNDDAGSSKLRIDAINFTLAYHVKLNANNVLGGGLQGGFAQRRINYGNFQWGSQYNGTYYDPNLPSNEIDGLPSKIYVDCALGINWTYSNRAFTAKVIGNNYKKFNVGLSVFHVNRPDVSFTQLADPMYMKIVLHGQGLFSLGNSNMAVAPGFTFYNQGSSLEFFYGALMRYGLNQSSRYTGFVKGSAFSVGLFHRLADAFVAVFQYEFSDYRFGLSYDVNHSDLRTATRGLGGFEISASYMLANTYKSSRRR